MTKPKPKTNGKKTSSSAATQGERPAARQKRIDVYQVIYTTLKSNGGRMKPEDLEDACQKVKPESAGRYSSFGKSRFVFKDGYVLAEVSELGFKDALTYTQRRKLAVPHWAILTFPEKAAEYAKKLGLPMPKLDNPTPTSLRVSRRITVSPYLDSDGLLLVDGSCPQCLAEKSAGSSFIPHLSTLTSHSLIGGDTV